MTPVPSTRITMRADESAVTLPKANVIRDALLGLFEDFAADQHPPDLRGTGANLVEFGVS